MRFIDVVVRQAHPGPAEPPYTSFAEKMADAEAYRREEGIPWPVAVDDLAGTVHQEYGGLADPTYLIDVDGRVAYYNMWTHAPVLHEAVGALLAQGGRGVVLGEGVDRTPHLLHSITDGWKGLRRGLSQSYWDMEAAAGVADLLWLGHQMRPLLAPLTVRAEPLSPAAKWAVAFGAGLGAGAAFAALTAARGQGKRSG